MTYTVATAAGFVALSLAAFLVHRETRRRRTRRAIAIDDPRGIDEEHYVEAGGIEHWISIRGRDRDNPALFIIHGGPGCSYSIFTPILALWEEHFTIVQWDQRGTGKTLRRNGAARSGAIDLETMVGDAAGVAERVRALLGGRKLVVLASSMGTLIGIPLVQRRPELFAAYVGTDLNVSAGRDDAAHHATVARLERSRRTREARRLRALGPDPARWSARQWMKVGEWTTRSDPAQNRAIMKLLLGGLWFSPLHTLRDLRDFSAGMRLTTERWFPAFLSFDARRYGLEFSVPFFLFQGADDIHTPTERAVAYYESVSAPVRAMRLIEGAGHFAAFLRPGAFLEALLTHVRPIANDRANAA